MDDKHEDPMDFFIMMLIYAEVLVWLGAGFSFCAMTADGMSGVYQLQRQAFILAIVGLVLPVIVFAMRAWREREKSKR